MTTPRTATATAAQLEEELEARLAVYTNAIPVDPQFVPVPVVLAAGRNFALRDPGSVGDDPRAWNNATARTGAIGAREQAVAEERRLLTHAPPGRQPPGRAYPHKHPLAQIYTPDQMEAFRLGVVDTEEGSPIVLASQKEEAIDAALDAAIEAAGVKPGLRANFVRDFVATKLPTSSYFHETTDEDRAASLARTIKNAVAAAGVKESLFVEYDEKIAAADAASQDSHDASQVARIADLETRVADLAAIVARLLTPNVVRLAPSVG